MLCLLVVSSRLVAYPLTDFSPVDRLAQNVPLFACQSIESIVTYGKNNTTKIKTFNGSGFSEEADWETPTSLCASPKHNMVDVWLNQIVWKTPDSFLWTYGTPRRSEYQSGANRVGQIASYDPNGVSNNGVVKNLYLNQLLTAFSVGGTSYIEYMDYESYTTGGLNLKTNLYSLPHKSTIKVIHVYFSKLDMTAGQPSNLIFNLYKNNSTVDYLSNKTIPTNPVATSISYYPIAVSIPEVDDFYINISQATGQGASVVIRKIEIEYYYEEGDI